MVTDRSNIVYTPGRPGRRQAPPGAAPAAERDRHREVRPRVGVYEPGMYGRSNARPSSRIITLLHYHKIHTLHPQKVIRVPDIVRYIDFLQRGNIRKAPAGISRKKRGATDLALARVWHMRAARPRSCFHQIGRKSPEGREPKKLDATESCLLPGAPRQHLRRL